VQSGFDPQAHAQQHNLSNIGYETHTDSITGETRSIAYTEMSHEEYEALRQSPQGRVLELPPMPAEKVGNTLGMITFKPSVSPTRAALANPPEIPPEDVENPEAPEGERTSEKLKQLTAEREALNKKLINSDAADEYVRFDELHGSLNELIGGIKGEPGTIGDYAAQGTRGLLGFAKDALVGVGELAYEGSKLVFDAQQAMLTPAGIQSQILDAQILLENIRLGNVTTGTMSSGAANTATSVGKAIVAPVTDAWAKGQYVESVTRATVEIATLPFVALKSSKAAKAGEVADALSDANKATQALETAQDATTAVKSAEAIAKTDEVAKAANASDATKVPESKGPGGDGGRIEPKSTIKYRTAEDANAELIANNRAYPDTPPFKEGTTVIEREIQPGERFNMSMDDKQLDLLNDPDSPYGIGGWGTAETFNSQAEGLNKMAIKPSWKPNGIPNTVQFEVVKPFRTLDGIAGPQGSLNGGAQQYFLDLPKNGAKEFVKIVKITSIP
jgi:hypothetical protein